MNPDRWQQIEKLYNSALEVEAGQRQSFLEKACAGDESLRSEVEQLLASQPRIERFIESPALEVAARGLNKEQGHEGRRWILSPERWERVKQIYHTALEVESGRREAFLKEACAEDEGLIKEIASLLAREGNSEGLFESPALDAVAQALAQEQVQKPQENLIGQTMSHYRIEGKIGEGGMGVVFLAQDTSLNRKVALKFLPQEMQQDPLARKRFLREARSAAALNNPFICSIHEVGEFEGRDFIVMEYVDGQTLSDKLRRGRLPLNQVLQISVEVAEALQAAHSKGIIHRDLKPSNIMIMKTGHAMVMDFGLAKQIPPYAGIESKEESVSTMTRSGMTLGTLAYMSPEQLRGEEVDARSDIFSFGLVLYEILTGTHPFRKESPIETGSAILHEETKPVGAIAQDVPPDLEKLVRRCLRKDLERRFHNIADVKVALLELKEDLDSGAVPIPPVAAKQARWMLPMAISVIGLVALAGGYWLTRQRPDDPETPLVAEPLTSYIGFEDIPSFSPDGNFVAFQWCGEAPGANCDIWVKQIGVEPPLQLTKGPSVEFSPAWSPDGLFIAFLRQVSTDKSALMILPRAGGQERRLGECDAPGEDVTSFLAWTPDSKWLVFPSAESSEAGVGLSLLSVQTMERRRLTTPPAGSSDRAPAISPDGRAMAFVRLRGDRSDLCMLRLGVNYEPQGEQQVPPSAEEPYVHAADWFSNGSEVFFSRGFWGGGSLWRIAGTGSAKPRKVATASQHIARFAISRKGDRLAFTETNEKFSIWRFDPPQPNKAPAAPFPLIRSTRNQLYPTYSPDGKRVAFDTDISGHSEIWVCNNDGSNAAKLTSFGTQPQWSPDGRSIAFLSWFGGRVDIFVVGADGGSPRRLGIEPPGSAPWPSWSHDSRWIYFRSNRSSMSEIWKIPAVGGGAAQISSNGESRDLPLESPDGKFLYYMHSDDYPKRCSVWKMPVEGGDESKVVDSAACLNYAVGERGIYFLTPPDAQGRSDINLHEFQTDKTRKILTIAQRPYFITVSPDGRTILYTIGEQAGSDLMLIENLR